MEGAGDQAGVQTNYRCPSPIDGETLHWQQLLQRLIALIRVIATQNIALGGTTDRLNEPNNGNFLKFVEMLGILNTIR